MGATRRLAEFIHDLSYDDIPELAIAKAKLLFMNWSATTVGGYVNGRSELDPMVETLSPFFGQPQATLITKKKKADLINTALINGTASHYLDFDDGGVGFGHPSPPIMPAAIATGEYREISGKKLIEAVVVGVEVGARISESVNPEHYAVGWHGTATLGLFGACAAVSKILCLSIDKIETSLGIAGTQAAGLRQSFGTMCKPFHAGKAASNGILSAVLAESSFTGPRQIIEGAWGFGKVLSPKFDETRIYDIGKTFKIEEVNFKRYPSCYATHHVISCIFGIMEKHHPAITKVRTVTVKTSPFCLMTSGNMEPRTGLEGKFSIRYCAALAFMKGKATVTDFTDEAVNTPDIRDFMSSINVVPEKSFKQFETEVQITFVDGTSIKDRINDFSSLDKAVSLAEWESMLEVKCCELFQQAFPPRKTKNIISAIKNLEEIDNIKNVVELMS